MIHPVNQTTEIDLKNILILQIMEIHFKLTKLRKVSK